MNTQQDLGEAIEDVSADTRAYIWKNHRGLFVTATIVSIVASVALTVSIYLIYTNDPGNFDARVISFPIFPLLALFALYGYYRSRVQHLFVQQMGAALGYSYAPSDTATPMTGSFAKIGWGASMLDVLSGTYQNCPVRIYTYRYMTGGGKNTQVHYCTVFELRYGSMLPHVVMNFPLLTTPMGLEKVELEGNFGKEFSLHVEPGKQMEIREIFQPDAMQDCIAALSSFTMEIYEDRVYLIRKGELSNKQVFLDLAAGVDRVFTDILPGLRSVASDMPNPAPSPAA